MRPVLLSVTLLAVVAWCGGQATATPPRHAYGHHGHGHAGHHHSHHRHAYHHHHHHRGYGYYPPPRVYRSYGYGLGYAVPYTAYRPVVPVYPAPYGGGYLGIYGNRVGIVVGF